MKSVGELSHVCSQIVLKCLYLARIGRPDILWSLNKLARSITKWTKACDKRLNRLISYIHHTCEYKQYCHVGNTAKQCRLGTVSRLWLRRRSWRFKSHFWEEHYAFLEVIRLFPRSWMCKKQTAVSHSSTDSEIISFGHWTEIGWFACSGAVGSNCFCSWKCFSCFRSIGNNLRMVKTNTTSLTRKSMQ